MDGDQQPNFYYLDPVAIMNRFIGQLKFAGKTYMIFEKLESKQRIRQDSESKLPISGSPAQTCSVQLLYLPYADKSFFWMH